MKFSYSEIDVIFDTEVGLINTIVIENTKLFYSIIEDIYSQLDGNKGKSIVSKDSAILDFAKYVDITTSFIPFEINRKNILNKIVSDLESKAQKPENYEKTMQLLVLIEKYIDDISQEYPCILQYNKNNISSILKAVGIEIQDDSNSLAEKLINYMELVREFDKDRLFFFVNLRSYIDESSLHLLFSTILSHKYHVILIESNEYPMEKLEKRITIDKDLCLF